MAYRPDNRDRGDNSRPRDEGYQMYSINPAYQDTSPINGDHRPPFVVDVPPDIPMERRDNSYDEDRGLHGRNSSRRHWASSSRRAEAELISQLPSKQLEQASNDAAASIRRKKSRKKSYHGTLRHRDLDGLAASLARDSDLMDELDGEMRMNEMLRDMPVNLANKKELREGIQKSRMTLKRGRSKRPGWAKRTKYTLGIAWMHFKYRIAELTYSLELWKSLLKRVEGHFGTGVTSYFLFLKWIFLLNIPVFILTLCFIIIPQILYIEYQYSSTSNPATNTTNMNSTNITTSSPPTTTKVVFTGEELLTGANYFEQTVMYYGYYTDQKVHVLLDTPYDMKYAYLFTCGGYYILCLIILALSISRSYKKNYIEASGTFNFYMVTKVFSGWDYNITAEDAARLRQISFKNEVKEFLSGKKYEKEKRKLSEKCNLFLIRIFTNLVVFCMIGGSAYLVYYMSDTDSIKTSILIIGDLAMPLVATGIIFFFPFIFNVIGHFEKYMKPQTELYVGMVRNMLLKAVILGILAYFWFNNKANNSCWETSIGEEIYRLVLVDFIFILLSTFFMEFIRSVIAQYCCTVCREPEFDIGRNTLDLIYSQALCWLGTFYSPLLSLIMTIKLFIIFYVKVVSCLMNCKPSLRPWRASKTHTIFLGFLFFFFLLAAVAVAYGIILVKPSAECGPYHGLDRAYDVVTDLVDSWKKEFPVLHEIVKIASSPGFIASLLVAICVITYYMRIVMVGHKEMVKLLRQQLAMEGRDKAYLLNVLHEESSKRNIKLKATNANRLMFNASSTTSLDSRSPGGRQFAKTMAQTAAVNTSQGIPVLNRRGRHVDSNDNLNKARF